MTEPNQKNNLFAYRAALLASFLVPVLIMILIFIARGIFPFGSSSFLRTDMYHQYAPFFQEFREKLKSGESLLYSWNIGGGTNFAALYAYYLASPVNWLILLVPKAYVIEFMTYLIVLKTGLCGLTFTWYLTRHCRTRQFSTCFFGIFYALSGYMAAYSWNIMWLDCIVLLPLIVLGLERLVRDGKCFFYCLTLGLSILSNYYISIMICIFCVLYFAVLVATQEEPRPEKIAAQTGRFALFSLLAGGLAAGVLLPEIYALGTTASGNSTFPKDVTSYFSILQMLARHLVLVETETGLDHWPNLFCGVAALLLIPLYAMNRRYSYKEKIGYLVLIFFFLASFSLNALNFTWHGFHYPNSLPCRQSFLYIFLVLVMCYKGCQGIPERSTRQVVTAFWIAVGFIVAVQAVCTDEAITWAVIWVSLIFVGLYALLIYHYRRARADRILLAILTMLVVITENAWNTSETSITTVNRDTYTDIDEAAAQLSEFIEKSDNSGFYRTEKVSHRTKNDGAWLSYPSASTFSSMSYASMTQFYKNMGMEGSTNSFSTNGATPFAYSLLGVRYLYSTEQLPESTLYTQIASAPWQSASSDVEQTLYLYENLYTLPLGFVLPDSMQNWKGSTATPFSCQDSFISAATGVTTLFEMLPSSFGEHQSTITVTSPGIVYAYSNGSAKDVTVSHGSFSKQFSNVNRGYLMNLGYCEEGETIYISSTDSDESVNITAAVFLEDAFREAYRELSRESMTVESYSSDHVTASLTTDGGLLVMTIPADDGWSLKVDGISVQPSVFADTFLCFSIGEGTHTIELQFYPQGLRTGILISLGSAAVLLALYLALRFRNRFFPAEDSTEPAHSSDTLPAAHELLRGEQQSDPSASDLTKDPPVQEPEPEIPPASSEPDDIEIVDLTDSSMTETHLRKET